MAVQAARSNPGIPGVRERMVSVSQSEEAEVEAVGQRKALLDDQTVIDLIHCRGWVMS
jgi:hypothetical protein